MKWIATLLLVAALEPGAPDLGAAQAKFRQGLAHYELFEYADAIQLWNEAYSLIPDDPDALEVRLKIVYNLAVAHKAAYALDLDVIHLRQAKLQLERYLTGYAELHGVDATTASGAADARELLRHVEEQLAELEREPDEETEPPVPPPDPGPPSEPPPAVDDPGRPPTLTAGIVLVSLGGAAGILSIGAAASGQRIESGIDQTMPGAERASALANGRIANQIAVFSAVAAGVLVVSGGVLLGVGLAKRRKQRGSGSARAGIGVRF